MDKIEANANLVLWCVHILGPDDLIAKKTHAEAVAHAEALNKAVLDRDNAPDDVLCFAYAAPWRASVADWEYDMVRNGVAVVMTQRDVERV